MANVQAAAALGSFIAEHAGAIEKRAIKSLKYELATGLSRADRKASVPSYAGELGRLLLERGTDAPRLWAEAVRPYGREQFEARRDVADLIREFKALLLAVQEEWARRVGPMDYGTAALLADCIHEGQAAAAADYLRRVRSAQVEFRESALIETILEHLDEGILLTEADGTLSYATRPAIALLGPELEAAIGTAFDAAFDAVYSRIQATHMDGRPLRSADRPDLETLRIGRTGEPLQIRISGPRGERFIEMAALPIWNATPSADGGRTMRGVITTLRDRTEDIRKSTALRDAYQELTELHARLLHRTRNQAIGELATGAAHALNNLLNTMALRMRLLREAPTARTIDGLNNSVGDVAALVARLQQFASPQAAGPVQSVDLNSILREALTLVRPDLQPGAGAGAQVVQSLDAELPSVRANAAEMREILVNLLLTAKEDIAEQGRLTLSTLHAANRVQCRIAWRGKGELTGEAESWFEPFAAGAPPAISFALSSSRAALARWGGGVAARLGESGELQFTFDFVSAGQAAEAEALPATVAAHAGPGAAPGVREVLVIDDDPDNAFMLAEVLEAEGYSTATATRGEEAIALWQRRRFDIALVDLVMPDMTGVEIAAELLRLRPDARLALVTGWEMSEDERQKAPVEAVFRKPVDLERLLAFLEGGPASRNHAEAGAPAS